MGGGDADVIHQRIEPDVGDKILVEGQGNAPVQTRRRTRDAQIFQFVVLEKAEHFVAAMIRPDKRRILFDVINQPLLLLVQLEEIIFLLQFDDFAVAGIEGPIRTAVLLGQEGFLLRGIKARVGFFIDLAGLVHLREAGLDDCLVSRVGGADKIVVGQFQFFGECLPIRRQLVAISLGRFAFGLRGLLDLLAVFVEAGQEKSFLTEAAARPRDDIGDDFLVGVAEMRLAVDVINRGGDVKPFVHWDEQCDGQM